MASHWATSKDVAELAGVSRAAVSVVLNGARGNVRVSEATRERILQAAAELNYSPNLVARHLRKRRSGVVALAIPSFSDGLYERTIPYQLSHHVMRAAVERGSQLIEMALPVESAAGGHDWVESIREHKVDGVILGWPETPQQVERLSQLHIPVVQVMKPQLAPGTTTITVDSRGAFDAAVGHLTELGHTRIAYLGSSSAHPVERARLSAFTDALAAHGCRLRKTDVQLSDRFSIEDGQRLTERLLALPRPPTAVLAGDGLILGALRALHYARLRVPTEFSVVGFDDELAASLYPPLSSIRQPIHRVAEVAVTAIDKIVSGDGAHQPRELVLTADFVIRESTGSPAPAALRNVTRTGPPSGPGRGEVT